MIVGQYNFIQTCRSCPEQYNVFKGVEQVGYVRLRNGCLLLCYPNVDGRIVYRFDYDEDYIGEFPTVEEMYFQLKIMAQIIDAYEKRKAAWED